MKCVSQCDMLDDNLSLLVHSGSLYGIHHID